MAPRNNDPSTSYKRNYPVENNEVQDVVPCILHKKHKVVKLVKSQIKKIRQEGFICAVAETHPDDRNEEVEFGGRSLGESSSEEELLRGENRDNRSDGRNDNRHDARNGSRSDGRNDSRNDSRDGGRNDSRSDSRSDGRQSNRHSRSTRQDRQPPPDDGSDYRGCRNLCPYILLFLAEFLLLLLLMVYISAGPLSNSMAHTPIPPGSFVRTERPCYLEKKYLLRWSRPEYME